MRSTRTMKLYHHHQMPSMAIAAANSSVNKEMKRSTRSPYLILTCAQRYQVFDSIFKSVDSETRRTINMLFKHAGTTKTLDIRLLNVQKQKVATTVGFLRLLLQLHCMEKLRFCQESMRAHLVRCFYVNKFTMFPTEDSNI